LPPCEEAGSAAGWEIGACRTTRVVVSPVSITSVAIRIAPITRTTRPPSTPAARLETAERCFGGEVAVFIQLYVGLEP
jgi:hypothetical protein